MPRRVPVIIAQESGRATVEDHVRYLLKRERFIYEPDITERYIELESLLERILTGDTVTLAGDLVPGGRPGDWYVLDGDQLLKK